MADHSVGLSSPRSEVVNTAALGWITPDPAFGRDAGSGRNRVDVGEVEVSDPLARLYLNPDRVGTAWLLDPDCPQVIEGLRAAHVRGPDDPCDPAALIADLPHLRRLLRERHIGMVTGTIADTDVEPLLERWRDRLADQAPATWGEALGTDFHELRMLTGDNHLRARGEDRTGLLRRVDPRAAEPRGVHTAEVDSPHETVTEDVIDDVLCLRVTGFGDDAAGHHALTRWVDARSRHFAHHRIIIDLRGNTGGNDVYTRRWCADATLSAGQLPSQTCWYVDGQPLVLWNAVVLQEGVAGPESVSAEVRRRLPTLTATTTPSLVEESDPYPAGASPWRGRMLVVTDRDTASAAESSAYLLKTCLGARIIGGRSAGMLCYGDVAPYLLPHSGMMFRLPARYTPAAVATELVGMPVDAAVDPRTPVKRLAADFDALWRRAGG
ncbi:peptidase S41-like protein [Stackebrandtia endophytica]|uniref:Peptidase S41-like protein n=1 Tax=Stackebrandtia endophytica TaxID=1496996 RepID=A0A543ARQ7_9ACTN|nr:S41 family peptidase [Stackebrandtia endophytica]TQL75263.1 peptidase S41-like protein [Stackebrandtia endophytica]